MGIFERIRSMLGSDRDRHLADGAVDRGETAGGQPGIDRGEGSIRVGVDPGDERKTGGHGSHWDAVVETNAEIREATVAAIDDGEGVEGRPVDAGAVEGFRYPVSGPAWTRVVAVDGTVTTAYPTVEGRPHDVRVEEVIDWANDVEAQLALELGGDRFGAFDAGYFRRANDYAPGDALSFEVAGLAYDLGPVGAADLPDGVEGGEPTSDVETLFGFEGGDVDDYVVRGRVRAASTHEFLGRTIHRLELPFFGDGSFPVYAADHVLGDHEPDEGDEVEGVVWLQGRAV